MRYVSPPHCSAGILSPFLHPRCIEQVGVGKPGSSLPQMVTDSMSQSAEEQGRIKQTCFSWGIRDGRKQGSLKTALLLQCGAADITHPLQSTKAPLILCQSDSLFPPIEKFGSAAVRVQPCCG